MSISSAFSNALSGMTVAARAADLVSSNVANAMTEGYGVRSLDIGARSIGANGQGALVVGVTRHEDAILLGDRRRADAGYATAQVEAAHLLRLEGMIGTPDQPGSLAARAAGLEAALSRAAAAPHEQMRLGAAVDAAVALAEGFNSISDGIQAERLRADRDIALGVARVNEALGELSALNIRIRKDISSKRDVSALLDAQARLVDQIAPLIPLESRRDQMGSLQLYSADGHQLLGRKPAVLGFQPALAMTPSLTRADGNLGGLTLNGQPLSPIGRVPPFDGGEMAALFALRDDWGVSAQGQLDAVAQDLIARFDDPALDASRAPGQPGLFTDAGAGFDPANAVGLAQRIAVTAAVLPEQGGAHWRLRDGLGATAPGPSGAAGLLVAQGDALAAYRPTAAGFSPTPRSFGSLVADHLSEVGLARQMAEGRQANLAARLGALRGEELTQGVDSDAELQHLMQIEQIYAANARVVAAVQAMLDQLIGMGR